MTSTNLRVLPAALRDDIDALAAHFHATNEFKGLFIGSLVPWNDLVGIPNPGHAAVADLLISRAARAALSANFDVLIEQWAMSHKIAMQGALNGHEATGLLRSRARLLGFMDVSCATSQRPFGHALNSPNRRSRMGWRLVRTG